MPFTMCSTEGATWSRQWRVETEDVKAVLVGEKCGDKGEWGHVGEHARDHVKHRVVIATWQHVVP
ncbi:uncharacterized protein G2W53_001973 [Senna tora]|uniref:Uncharacterized protein n=1 Tax=Senna tora TaxID=362788 RepID=A0A834XKV1_9FABA|nr:uncharacterized protein G2W53_001973 [Senna tora]